MVFDGGFHLAQNLVSNKQLNSSFLTWELDNILKISRAWTGVFCALLFFKYTSTNFGLSILFLLFSVGYAYLGWRDLEVGI